jgi:hypothetical protein
MLQIRDQVVRSSTREALDVGILHDRLIELKQRRRNNAADQPLSSPA